MQFHSLRLLRILSKYIYQVNQSFHKHNYPHGPQIQQSAANNELSSLFKDLRIVIFRFYRMELGLLKSFPVPSHTSHLLCPRP